MFFWNKITILSLIVTPLIANCAIAATDSANINLLVTGACNNNSVCESALGENQSSCSADCGCNYNGSCEQDRSEDQSNCSDCSQGGTHDTDDFSVYIRNINVVPGFTDAEISWKTTRLAACNLYWGKTTDYSEEIFSETTYKTEHSVTLEYLAPSTIYHFKISCQDAFKLSDATADKYFKTLTLLDNVKNFTALGENKKIVLSWQNPSWEEFQKVLLLRSENFYPLGAAEGAIIYEGSDSFFIDTDLINNKQYYYTIFAIYEGNNMSSGASATAIPFDSEITGPVEPIDITETPVTPTDKALYFLDFDFYSEGKKLEVKNQKTIELKNQKQLIISIDSNKLPKNTKTIFAELRVGNNSYLYIFKENDKKNIFNTALTSPDNAGSFPLSLVLLDKDNKKIQQLEGELKVSRDVFPIIKYFLTINFLWLLWIVLILLLIIWWLLKKRKNN